MLPPPPIRGIYRTDLRARAAYAEGAGIYRILPQAVCLPADVEDVRGLIGWAADHQAALVLRGAGSGMGGGNVGEGVLVDLTSMADRRLELNAEQRRATTSAGVTLAQLNTAASNYGLRLPPDPSSGRWATLGGMVSTNAAGARSVRHGSVRRWVDAVTLLTADGERITLRRGEPRPATVSRALDRFSRDAKPAIQAAAALIRERFPRTRKNSSGYALDAYLASGEALDLIIGAEGTLGIVIEIEWHLDPIPPCRAGIRVALRSLDVLGDVIKALISCQPSALELLDRSFLELVGTDALAGAGLRFRDVEAVLLVELERDDAASLREALSEATARARPLAHSVDTAFSLAAAERLWGIRHAASPILAGLPEGRRSLQVIEDACVPLDRMTDYIRAVRRSAAERRLQVVMFGHAGDGHIHVNLLPEITSDGWEAAVRDLLEEVTETVVHLGGTLSGEHGDGRLRAAALSRVYGPEMVELFRLVKRDFDPLGIFNPGIILPSGQPAISRLKVGDRAEALPADIERGLRDIERTGGYGRNRLELAGEEPRNREPGTRNQKVSDHT
jgi:FAD/FMN-containing dehydrogenase